MKKILIATSAIAAVSATSAFALDVKTSGAVEYKYTKDKAGNTAQNAKLSQGSASVKFAASGASNGLAYGAFVTFKSNGAGAIGAVSAKAGSAVDTTATTYGDGTAAAVGTTAGFSGWSQDGRAVQFVSVAGVSATGAYVMKAVSAVAGSKTPANNATTQSAIWVSGAFGKIVAGQDGSAAGSLAVSGKVSAASYGAGDHVASAGYDQKSAERLTYTAPTFVDGLTVAYTHSFKGNTSTTKSDAVKAPKNWGVQYATDVMGVGVKAAYVEGTTGKTGTTGSVAKLTASLSDLGSSGTAAHSSGTYNYTKKTYKNTGMGVELAYGAFTVGYGAFTNEKKFNQTKDTSGSNYGVKYNGGAWAVGYTVLKSEDANKYHASTTWNKSATTNAISASYTVADGFSVYASRSTNKVKSSDNKTAKKNYTIVGAKISF